MPTSYTNVATVAGDSLAAGASQTDADGGFFVALDGDNSGSQTYIQQTINGLTPGAKYNLNFLWGGIQLGGGYYSGPTTESLQVSLGSQAYSTAMVSECSQCFSGWLTQNFQFTAGGSSQVLQFLSVGSGVPPLALIDAVSLTPATSGVPEPATWAIMILGLGGVGMAMRRRGAARAA